MKSEYEMSLNDYIAIIKDRALLLGLGIVLILAASIAVAVAIPPVYQASGTILVESPQISPDLISANSGFADDRIEVIRQRVMSREHLLAIVDKYHLFAGGGYVLSEADRIEQLRNAIEVSRVNSYTPGRGESTIAFKVSFDYKDPAVARDVANDLVTLFLDENIKQRTERASETTEFLSQEADKLRSDLEVLENKLADFKQQHANALPEHQEMRMNMLSRAQLDLQEVDRDYKAAQEEMRYLEMEQSAALAGSRAVPLPSAAPGTEQPEDLATLKARYVTLRARYTEAHPDVRAVKRKIEALEASGAKGGPAAPVSLDAARAETRVAAAQSRIKSLLEQKRELASKISSYEADILETPQVERGMVTLTRDHDNARKKYEEIRTKEMNAKISENLEQENKAERFVLLEPPLMPERPIKPNRKKIVALGVVLAPAGAGGLVMLLEALNQRIRGVNALGSVLGRRVLAAIPFIPTQEELARRRKWRIFLIVGGLVAAVLALVLLHIFYMPLDLLLFKVMARFA
ncbi:GumC family protein [Pseudomonas citronellolis]|uniref:GumC family protein n=1 Tax=Pseudomonas citronellolis TaxID=53408 RepID=UPI0023E472A5|nr:Wzz/FepE/Etk N-terminal domain-containing protein [Pseudomonas citronellolis]MDF3933405.1 lipopolysaccharide biosynthesis protein [Pseudomonas citronellolis]